MQADFALGEKLKAYTISLNPKSGGEQTWESLVVQGVSC